MKEVDVVQITFNLTARIIWVSTALVMAGATMIMVPAQYVAAEEYIMPDAITAEPDETRRKAWRLFHDREIRSNIIEPRAEAAILLKMRDGEGLKVTEDTVNTSFAYRLLVAKMPGRYGEYPGEAPAGNIALRHFDAGVSYLTGKKTSPLAKRLP